MVDRKLVNGNITGQVLLMNTTERTQEITQPRPATFIGIDVDLPNAISIVIPSPFVLTVTNRMSHPLEFVVAIILIGIQSGFRSGELLHERTQGRPLGVFHHPHPDLTRTPPDDSTNRRPVIGISPSTPALVGSFARRVLRIRMPFAFFPPRSGTFRQFQRPDRQGGFLVGLARHWLGVGAGLRSLSCD